MIAHILIYIKTKRLYIKQAIHQSAYQQETVTPRFVFMTNMATKRLIVYEKKGAKAPFFYIYFAIRRIFFEKYQKLHNRL